MPKNKSVTVGFMGRYWEGPTKAAALKAAETEVTRLVQAVHDHEPVIVQVGGYAYLVWRSGSSWTYREIQKPNQPLVKVITPVMTTGSDVSFGRIVLDAIGICADNAWNHEVENDKAFYTRAFVANRVRGIDDTAIRAAIASRIEGVAFQRLYRQFIIDGLNSNDAHRRACDERPNVRLDDIDLALAA